MHRNCIFCLTLISDSLFFSCKRRLVQTNVTKLLLTKHNFLLFSRREFFFFFPLSITASTQFTALLSFACAGLMKEKEISFKGNYIYLLPSFSHVVLECNTNALLCQTCQDEHDAPFDGQCSDLWPTTDWCRCIGDGAASIWLAAAVSHARVSAGNIHAWGATSCYSIWSGERGSTAPL